MSAFKIEGVHKLKSGSIMLFSKTNQIIVDEAWMKTQVPGPHKAAVGGYYTNGVWMSDSQFKQRQSKESEK